MTDLEVTAFAISHGLTEEEAAYILARRKNVGQPSGSRLSRAMEALQKAQKKVGVHPVAVEGGRVRKSFDEEAEENLDRFYKKKRHDGSDVLPLEEAIRSELETRRVEDWEEPP